MSAWWRSGAAFLGVGLVGLACTPGAIEEGATAEADTLRDAEADRRPDADADAHADAHDEGGVLAADAGRAEAAGPHDLGSSARSADTALDARTPAPFQEDETLPPVVPVVWIDVGGKAIPEGTKIPGRLKIIEDHDGTLKDIASRPATLAVPIGIEVRGATSAGQPKKPYGVELRDDAGNDRDLPVLGMPPESDWVFYACYWDTTCLKNAIIYGIGRRLGRYNVRLRFVEVFLDGKYVGLYNVIEKIKRGKSRLPIPAPAVDAASGDLTGGYIFRHEQQGKGAGRDWRSALNTSYTFYYPKPDRISPAQRSYLTSYVDKFEAVMASADWADPKRGYRPWIDLASWLDYGLITEFSMNVDGYRKSTYLYKLPDASGGLLAMGPLWDYDWSLGGATGSWVYVEYAKLPLLFYWLKLWTDPSFQNDLRCRWKELRRAGGPLALDWLYAKIDAWVKHLAQAEPRDHMRWPPMVTGYSYAADISKLKEHIARRLTWMDTNLRGQCPAPN